MTWQNLMIGGAILIVIYGVSDTLMPHASRPVEKLLGWLGSIGMVLFGLSITLVCLA